MNKYIYVVVTSILVVVLSVGYYIYSLNNIIPQTKKDTPKKIVNLLEGKTFLWIKSELNINNEIVTPQKKDKYAISFLQDGKVKIATDCNSGFGEYEVDENKLLIGNISSTEKYCPDSQEGIFFNELISAQKYELDGNGNLSIDIKLGTLFLKEINSIEQVNGSLTNSLVGKEYKWMRIELKNNKIILPKVQGKFVLTFHDDLKFSVTTDCNNNGGVYSLNENNLTFSDIVSTKMYCEESQEDIFIRYLQKTSSFEILPDETLLLILSNNEGRIYFR